jgi:hypothetical protein
MAIKSGFSHSFATLILTVISSLLLHLLKDNGFFDKTFGFLSTCSMKFTEILEKTTEIRIAHELFPTLFIACILAFLWGIVFHIARKT